MVTDHFLSGLRMELSVAGRAVALWLLVRLAAGLFSALAGESALDLTVKASLIVIAVSGILAVLEARKNNEDLLIANLGTSPVVFILLCSVPPLIGEVVVALAIRG